MIIGVFIILKYRIITKGHRIAKQDLKFYFLFCNLSLLYLLDDDFI